ncbi:MAG: 30S ribosomal protein S18 [Candidatus Omnitrophica bacterium]|nr:30S ribosomal protein S18 [Candidatus Omnitrophota bacterium]MBU4458039.1 30S ribosomal protein S18 [Candidatus Omnitrophota bacterium]
MVFGDRKKFQKRDKDKKKKGAKKKFFRKKTCKFCEDKVKAIDYKDAAKLRRFITEKGKILPSRMTGNCAKHQRHTAAAIKRARQIALLPFAGE